MALLIKRLSATATLPTRGSDHAVGYDLYSTEGCVVLPGRRAVLPTGIAVNVPGGTYGRIAPRSGLAVKHGISIGAGVVDPDYRGEIKVVMFNHDRNAYVIKPGYRIAQLILEKCVTPAVEEVEDLDITVRGDDGFGSTGMEIPSPLENAPVGAPVPEPEEEIEPEPADNEIEHADVPDEEEVSPPDYMAFDSEYAEPEIADVPEAEYQPEPEGYY